MFLHTKYDTYVNVHSCFTKQKHITTNSIKNDQLTQLCYALEWQIQHNKEYVCNYYSMYNTKNTIKEKVIYMQAVAHRNICGLKHIANLYNITIVR